MNFLTQQQEVAAHLGLDENDTDQQTLIQRWLNSSQREIADAADWPFLEAIDPEIIQTVTDYTTGTVTVAAGGTTATTSATIADSKANQYIQFASDDAWYRITAHTAGTDSLTISPAALTANTAATYTIRKILYPLSTSVDRIRRIRSSEWPYELQGKPSTFLNPWSNVANQTGKPRVFFVRGFDTSKQINLTFWPFPSSTVNLYVEYLAAFTDLSSDSDVSIIPPKWHSTVMIDGALYRGYQYLDDSRDRSARQNFLNGLQEMKNDILPNLNEERQLQPSDGKAVIKEPILPGDYPLA